jgi:hypothetical protein
MGAFRLLGVFADLNFVGQGFESVERRSLFFRRHVIVNVIIRLQTLDFGSQLDIHHSVTSALWSSSHLASCWQGNIQILAQVYRAALQDCALYQYLLFTQSCQ